MLKVKTFAASAALLAAALGGSAALAAPAPLAVRFPLTTCTTCVRRTPSVATIPSGNFMAVWEGSNPQDPRGVLGRFFQLAGTSNGQPLLLNTTIPQDQFDVDVAADATGYVTAWTSVTGATSDVYAQRFSAAGARVGTPILVNVDPAPPAVPAIDFKPAVAKLPTGGFAVVWTRLFPASATTNATPPEVLSRVFTTAGAPVGPPVKISTGLVNGDRPSVCADSLGRFVAVWTVDDLLRPFEPSLIGVTARRMSKTNAPLGPEMVIAPATAYDSIASVACGKGNVFVVAWQSDQPPALRRSDILAQRYQMTGAKIGGTILVNKIVDNDQRNPSVAMDPAGNFVVVWESTTDNGGAIMGRRFTVNGAPTGDDFAIYNTANVQEQKPLAPDVAAQGTAGNFLVVWQNAAGLYGQRFKP